MNYLQKDDRRPKKAFTKWLIFVIFLVLVIFFSSNLTKATSRSFSFFAYPFWKAKTSFLSNDFYLSAFLKSRLKLVRNVEELEGKLLISSLKLKGLELLVEENKNLKALIGREDISVIVPALVLARPPQINYDFLIIDLGKSSDISLGQKVFFENVLLGEVVEIFGKTSKVKLYSSSGTETATFIDRIDLPVKAKGRGGGNFEAEVPKEAPIEEGDFLVVLGNSRKLLGQIEHIENEPTKSFKRLFFRFPVNLNELKWVTVEMS